MGMETEWHTFRGAFGLGEMIRTSFCASYNTCNGAVTPNIKSSFGSSYKCVDVILHLKEENLPVGIEAMLERVGQEKFFSGLYQLRRDRLLAVKYSIPYV